MKIEHMRVQNLKNPIGIQTKNPILSYRLSDTDETNGQKEKYQQAYHVLVASSVELLEKNHGDLWDSGIVYKREPFGIRYEGKELQSRQIVFWKVKIWDQNGKDLGWSESAFWEMGLYPNDWEGKWIGQGDDYKGNKASAPMFASDFQVNLADIQYARLYISGLGLFVASVNGKQLSDTLFDPGESDATKSIYYVTYDITSFLRQGENTLGVILGNGQYTNFQVNPVMAMPNGTLMKEHRYQKNDGRFVKPGIAGDKKLIAQLEITYKDGCRKRVLISDEKWEWTVSPIVFQNWYGGEDYDATAEQLDWNMPENKRINWKKAFVMKAPDGVLAGREFLPIQIVERFGPKEIRQLDNGNWLVDMGRNGAGFPELHLNGTTPEMKGRWIRMYPAELLKRDGSGVNQASCTQSWNERYHCAIVDSYRIKGTGHEVWHPLFSYQGFRYVEVEGFLGAFLPENIQYCIVRTANEKCGVFRTSDETLNQISSMVERSMESNMFGSFTDCPQIEKLGWIETSHLMFRSLAGTYDISSWMKKIIHDIMDSQLDETQAKLPGNEPAGYVPAIIPEYQRIVGLHRDPNWNGACIFTPWEYYQYYGDSTVLKSSYPTMMRYLKYLSGYLKNYLLEDYAQMGEWGELEEHTPVTLVATCSYFRMLVIVKKIAEMFGTQEEVNSLDKQAARVREAFHNHSQCYDARKQIYGNDSQASYGCVIYSGIVPECNHEMAVERLVKAVERRDYHLSSGEVGLKQVFTALAENGRNDVVYRMVMNKTSPSYRCFADAGFTTLPEYWNCDELWNGMERSRNHAMMGHVKEWMMTYMLGVKSLSPGFGEIVIEPWMPEGMTEMKGTVPTPYGNIEIAYRREMENEDIKVIVPPGIHLKR